MITKTDCYLLLADLEKDGVDTKEVLTKLTTSTNLPIDVIKFINDNRNNYEDKNNILDGSTTDVAEHKRNGAE